MAYFHSKWVRSRGGSKGRQMRRLCGETIEEIRNVHRLYPEVTTLNLPPSGRDCHKSKSLPMLWVDADQTELLEDLGSSEVSEEHILVLTWLLREDWYRLRHGDPTGEVQRFFDREIRGNLIRLLRAGSWIDQPSSLGLEKLNQRLEKIDLGRRSDLNFSSDQSQATKYDVDQSNYRRASPDVAPVEEEELPDFEAEYRDGDEVTRAEIISMRPWMAGPLKEKYG